MPNANFLALFSINSDLNEMIDFLDQETIYNLIVELKYKLHYLFEDLLQGMDPRGSCLDESSIPVFNINSSPACQ